MSITQNPEYYKGNPNLKRQGINESWTKEKVVEYKKCMSDPEKKCTKL
jgi:hypothetical protein